MRRRQGIAGSKVGKIAWRGASAWATARDAILPTRTGGRGLPTLGEDAASSENSVAARHGGGEGEQQRKQRHLEPEKAPRPRDGLVRRRAAGAPPPQVRDRRWDREQADEREGADLGPEECVVLVIVPPLGGEDRAREADDE